MHFNGRAGREYLSVWEWLYTLWLAHLVWGRNLAIYQLLQPYLFLLGSWIGSMANIAQGYVFECKNTALTVYSWSLFLHEAYWSKVIDV